MLCPARTDDKQEKGHEQCSFGVIRGLNPRLLLDGFYFWGILSFRKAAKADLSVLYLYFVTATLALSVSDNVPIINQHY